MALGDSYSSGEGGSTFLRGTDRDGGWKERLDGWIPFWEYEIPHGHNMCHRSTRAYALRVYEDLDFAGDLEFHACSGAEIRDLLPGNQPEDTDGDGESDTNIRDHENIGELPQLEHLDEKTSLVTLSMGGNYAGFAKVLTSCFLVGITPWGPSCREALGEQTRARIQDLEDNLVALYNNIQRQAPNARVVVVGYPRIFPEHPTASGPSLDVGDLDEPIDPVDQKWMNHMARLLDDTIRNAARQAGVEYVGIYDVLDGHEIGSGDPWINDLDLELENGGFIDMGSFHPDDRGQAAIAERVEQRIRGGDAYRLKG